MLPNVLQGKCELVVHDDRALLALQGPSAVKVLAESSAGIGPFTLLRLVDQDEMQSASAWQHVYAGRCCSHLWTWTFPASISATSTSWTSMVSPAT